MAPPNQWFQQAETAQYSANLGIFWGCLSASVFGPNPGIPDIVIGQTAHVFQSDTDCDLLCKLAGEEPVSCFRVAEEQVSDPAGLTENFTYD